MPKKEVRTPSQPTCVYKQGQPMTKIINGKAICPPPDKAGKKY